MTKQDIMKFASLNERQVKAFGGLITIRDLSIKEMKIATSLDESEILTQMVSFSMVNPKMSVKDLESLGTEALPDLTNIVNELNGSKDGNE